MRLGAAFLAVALVGCGYSSRGSDLVCQPKKLVRNTPILCSDFTDVDVSLGVVQNGVGSMSAEDQWLVVDDVDIERKLDESIRHARLVKLTFDVKRWVWCPGKSDHVVTGVEDVK